MADDDPSLDVTLRLSGRVRSWCIEHSWNALAWSYERRGQDGFAAGQSLTLCQALEKRRTFDAQIAKARDDGWT